MANKVVATGFELTSLTKPQPPADRGHDDQDPAGPGDSSDERHRDAAEVASDWIWETDTNNCLTFVSKRFGEISGIRWSEVNSTRLSDLVALGFDAAGMAELQRITETRGTFQGRVYRLDLAGGVTRFWRLSGRPYYDTATGAYAGYRGTGTDVTTAMQREAALTAALRRAEAAEQEASKARRMLVDAIEAIPEGFVLHDADDRLVLCNARYREIYGLTPEMAQPGMPFEELLWTTCQRATYIAGVTDVAAWVAERMRLHRELDGKHNDQRLTNGRWLQIEERRTSDGGVVGIRVDVTEARRQEALERDSLRTTAELSAARLMQTSLLPSVRLQKEIIARTGLDIAGRNASCTELGGDLWGLTDLDRGRVGVYTIDVAGHGMTAAFTTFRIHTLIHELGAWLLEPARFLKELNVRLAELLQPGAFATMFYAVIDPAENCIRYAAAGSPPPVIRSARGVALQFLDSTGFPLGVTTSAEYAPAEAQLGPGGMLFLYSDVLTDTSDARGTRAEEAGAFALIERYAGEATAEAAVQGVCAPFLDPSGQALSDDLTAVCIRRP